MVVKYAQSIYEQTDSQSQPGPTSATTGGSSVSIGSAAPPPRKTPRLFSNYRRTGSSTITTASTADTVEQQLETYLLMPYNKTSEMADKQEMEEVTEDCLSFWHLNRKTLNKLYGAAIDSLAVPASSAAVECVFSHGGIFLRPLRTRMTDKLLSSLVFQKCNQQH
jgi:hypothetical protein